MSIPGLMNLVPGLTNMSAMARKREHEEDVKTEVYTKVQRGECLTTIVF